MSKRERGAARWTSLSLDANVETPAGARWRTLGPWVPRVYLAFAAALIPWDVYLALSLPKRNVSLHYRGTWVGFDLALIVVVARIGWLAHRRNPHVVLTAAAGATLLLADAWFDVTTAASGSPHTQALLAALFLELPAAALCAILARRGLRVLASRAAAFSEASADAGADPAQPRQ